MFLQFYHLKTHQAVETSARIHWDWAAQTCKARLSETADEKHSTHPYLNVHFHHFVRLC